MTRILALTGLLMLVAAQVSCVTNKDDQPAPPESERISSMPHNIPQSWEGTAGMPGMGQF